MATTIEPGRRNGRSLCCGPEQPRSRQIGRQQAHRLHHHGVVLLRPLAGGPRWITGSARVDRQRPGDGTRPILPKVAARARWCGRRDRPERATRRGVDDRDTRRARAGRSRPPGARGSEQSGAGGRRGTGARRRRTPKGHADLGRSSRCGEDIVPKQALTPRGAARAADAGLARPGACSPDARWPARGRATSGTHLSTPDHAPARVW